MVKWIVFCCVLAAIICTVLIKCYIRRRDERELRKFFRRVRAETYSHALGQCNYCTHSDYCDTYCSRCLWQPDGVGVHNLWAPRWEDKL